MICRWTQPTGRFQPCSARTSTWSRSSRSTWSSSRSRTFCESVPRSRWARRRAVSPASRLCSTNLASRASCIGSRRVSRSRFSSSACRRGSFTSASRSARRAASLRQLVFYGLALIGLFWAASTSVSTLAGIWDRIADAIAPIPGVTAPQATPPGVVLVSPPGPSRDDLLRFQLIGAVPAIVAGLALWLGAWIPLQRGLRAATADGEIERRSVVRKLAIYLVVLVSALAVLLSATVAVANVVERILGTPDREQYRNIQHDLGFPVTNLVVFATVWLFHRRVVQAEAARETEVERAATVRRLYTYLIAAIGLGMLAIGTAGAIGVFGSQLMGLNTHGNGETAAYIALVLIGAPAWALSWWQAQRRLTDDERRSLPRRGYLYLAILGGVLGVLVFGSAALYRLLNAVLAGSFPIATWHDIWPS